MLLFGVGIFWFEVRKLNLQQLWQNVVHLHFGWLLIALVCMLLSWMFEAFVVQIFLKGRTKYFPFHNAIRVPLVEQLFNNITPFASGGQPAQLVALMRSGVEAGRASSVLLMKFVVYQGMVLINFIFTMVVGFDQVAAKFSALALFIALGFVLHVSVIAMLLLVMYDYKFTKKVVGWLIIPVRWFVNDKRAKQIKHNLDDKIDSFYQESLYLKREKKKVFYASVLTLIQLLFYYSVPYFVILALGYTNVDFVRVLVMHVMIVMIISLFPIPGGSGGAEYSFKTLFATFIPSASKLVLGMLLWRVFTYYLGMFMGIWALAVKPWKAPQTDHS